MMSFLRPMRSESAPNTTKNGVPTSSAAIRMRFAEAASSCSVRSRKKSA